MQPSTTSSWTWLQDFEVEVVEEDTDVIKRSISGIGYEAYGNSAHIEYYSATHKKWLLGRVAKIIHHFSSFFR